MAFNSIPFASKNISLSVNHSLNYWTGYFNYFSHETFSSFVIIENKKCLSEHLHLHSKHSIKSNAYMKYNPIKN